MFIGSLGSQSNSLLGDDAARMRTNASDNTSGNEPNFRPKLLGTSDPLTKNRHIIANNAMLAEYNKAEVLNGRGNYIKGQALDVSNTGNPMRNALGNAQLMRNNNTLEQLKRNISADQSQPGGLVSTNQNILSQPTGANDLFKQDGYGAATPQGNYTNGKDYGKRNYQMDQDYRDYWGTDVNLFDRLGSN